MPPYFEFHHIGVTCFDIAKTSKLYVDAGYSATDTIVDPLQNVYVSVLKKEGQPVVELLAPVDDKSPVCKTLNKSGVTPYHVCYAVQDIKQAIADLKKERFMLISSPKHSNVFLHDVCFLFHKDMGLIELIEINS